MSRLHPAAWTIWLAGVCAFAFTVTNPLYLTLALAAVLLVHLAHPPDRSPVGRAVRAAFIAGTALLAVRMLVLAVIPNPGRTTIATLPQLRMPTVLGGLTLGGPVTAEVLAEGAAEGLRLVLVLVAFGVLNACVDLAALVRSVPPSLREVGLVAGVALAFVPSLLRSVRDVRDAQLLRGEHSLRTLAPSLVVPVLGMSLERALLLAESMDARGYGRRPVTRLRRDRPRPLDALVAAAGLVPLAARAAADASYTAYPVVHVPGFTAWAGIAALALVAPALGARR